MVYQVVVYRQFVENAHEQASHQMMARWLIMMQYHHSSHNTQASCLVSSIDDRNEVQREASELC